MQDKIDPAIQELIDYAKEVEEEHYITTDRDGIWLPDECYVIRVERTRDDVVKFFAYKHGKLMFGGDEATAVIDRILEA